MTIFDQTDLQELDKIKRLNLVNSCTGFKSANLIATISPEGIPNLAVFSSVTHLGSNPAMLGFILRPTTVPRHTYSNLKTCPYFTVNHISSSIIDKAHQTSANYEADISEFDAVGLTPHYIENCKVPFVAESKIQLLCKYLNEYPIHENDTIHIIAQIEKIIVAEESFLTNDMWLNLEKADTVAINGLDAYAQPKILDRFSYARVGKDLSSLDV